MGGHFPNATRTILLASLVVLSTAFALGQGIVTGSVAGTVFDPQKAVVVGAKVAAKNVATSVEFTSTTDDQGYFSIRSIPVGTYRVAVEAPNFKKLEVDGIVVNTGLTTDMGPLTLALGARAETVTVGAAAPLIETTTAQGGATFTTREVANLPLNGGFDILALFTPGIVSAGEVIYTNSNGAQFGSNGQRDRSNNFQIDGQYNNDNSVAGPAYFFGNQDALQEVQVVTNNFGVEYGRNSGAQVNYVTKSGTNNFHGSLFEYYTGSYADSMTNQEKSPLLTSSPGVARWTENRWGGTIGGPIVPNKIFFFAAYMQDTAKATSVSSSAPQVTPTPTGLAQLATCFPGNIGLSILNSIGPYSRTGGNPQPINTTTQDISNGVTNCTGVQVGAVTRSLPGLYDDYEAVGRVDFALSAKDQFFARYLFQQNLASGGFGIASGGGFPAGDEVDYSVRNQQIALDWTRNWTSHFVNQVRFGYVRLGAFYSGGLFSNCTLTSFPSGACPTLINMASPDLSFGLGSTMPQGGLGNNSQWQDNASWQHGRHIIKFGGEYDRQRSPTIFLPGFNGSYRVPNLTDLMSNTATQLGLANGNPEIPFKEQDAALYVGDDWRIRDNLTLNIGVRWEFNQSASNQLAAQTIARETNPATAFWDMTLPLNLRTVPEIPNVWHNFAPNVGFAWTPQVLKGLLGDNKTVIRGGFRMAYDPAFYNIYLNIATSAPTINIGTIPTAPQTCPGAPCSLVGPFGYEVRAAHLPDIPIGGNPGFRNQTRVTSNFHSPYAEEWSLGIQREVTSKIAAEVRYVGSHTVGEFQTVNASPQLSGLISNGFGSLIPAGVTPCSTAGQPGDQPYDPLTGRGQYANCNFTNVRMRANGAFGIYHSLQSRLKFLSWHGFSAVAAYTWSKNIDNASEIYSSGTANTIAFPQNPFCTSSCEKGLSALDYPNNLSIYWQYDLPFAKGHQGMMGHLLGGWSLAGTYRFLSGQEWTPATYDYIAFGGFGNTSCQNGFDSAFNASASSCRPYLGNPGAPIDTVGICTNAAASDCGLVDFFAYFNTGAMNPVSRAAVHWIYNDDVAAQFFGTPYGNVGRNPPGLRGDRVNTINLNLIKNTRISEKVNLKLEANLLNAFNTMFRGVPDPFIPDENAANGGSFGNTYFNNSGGNTQNALGTGLAQRRIVLVAHIIF